MLATSEDQMRILIEDYLQSLRGKSERTRMAYRNVLLQLSKWLLQLPNNREQASWDQLSQALLQAYFDALQAQQYSLSYRQQVKTVLRSFANWRGEQLGLRSRHPLQGITVEDTAQNDDTEETPRKLEAEQRSILKTLIDQAGDLRGAAIFALAYWAGCRVNDISWLRVDDCFIGPKIGSLQVGYQTGKTREIDLMNEARRPLFAYLHRVGLDPDNPYLFRSNRSPRLSEAGIHYWFRQLKNQASAQDYALIEQVSFHDLRHDFAHRARQAGWSLDEIAYYLGYSMPKHSALARYAAVNRHSIKQKLSQVKG